MQTEQSSLKVITRTARLSPASLSRLRRAMTEAAKRVRAEGLLVREPSALVKKAPRPEFEIHATLRFVATENETDLDTSRIGDPRICHRPREALRFGTEEIEALLRKAEPRLLKWIAESEDNAVLFTVNPLKALAAAEVELSADQFQRLRMLRKRNLANVKPQPPSPITKIKVSVG